MKLIIGLGNNFEEYKKTRHNVGFIFLDFFAKKQNTSFCKKTNLQAWISFVKINGESIVLIKPEGYINLSGNIVKNLISYYKIKTIPDNVLIIHDEIDFPLGTFKFKFQGTNFFHNGVYDIATKIMKQNLFRLRFGIGKNDAIEKKKWVLSKFNKEEETYLYLVFNRVEKAVMSWIQGKSKDFLMSHYN